jgi:hypothetical protein
MAHSSPDNPDLSFAEPHDRSSLPLRHAMRGRGPCTSSFPAAQFVNGEACPKPSFFPSATDDTVTAHLLVPLEHFHVQTAAVAQHGRGRPVQTTFSILMLQSESSRTTPLASSISAFLRVCFYPGNSQSQVGMQLSLLLLENQVPTNRLHRGGLVVPHQCHPLMAYAAQAY